MRGSRGFARAVALCALALMGTAGWLAAGGASSARAQDPEPEPTTVPAPTEPVPDPAPPPRPAPKPTPKPKSAWTLAPPESQPTSSPQPVSPAPATGAQLSSPGPQPSSPVQPRRRVQPKPNRVRPEAPTKSKREAQKPKTTKAAEPVVGLRGVSQAKEGQATDVGSLLIVTGLGLAIVCFGVAMIPATVVRWRPVALFVSERHVDLTLVGLLLFIVTAFIFFWTRAS